MSENHMNQYEEDCRKEKEQAIAKIPEMRKRLRAAGVSEVSRGYNGGGDEGDYNILDFIYESPENQIDDGLENEVGDLLEALVEVHHGGWYNNEGASGKISFNVLEGVVTIDHDENVMTTENFITRIPV